jgi:hypothetical protein
MAIELFNNEHPFHHVTFKFSLQFIKLVIENKLEPEYPRDCPQELEELILS